MQHTRSEADQRRMSKSKRRQEKWLERQERSKLSRDEIEMLRLKKDDLRAHIEDLVVKGGENNVEEETYTHFNQLPISQRTQMGLERGNYKKMTPIQSDSLHLALAGCDLLGAAKTGSGKTLCFVIPVLERLFTEHWDADMGVGALILSPTRELALQIFKVIQLVGFKHVLSAALLTGGRDVDEERKRLQAISLIVGTPGRVLHHLEDNAKLVLDNLQLFCMDEADRLLDLGFRDAITSILKYLPPQRQTLLFSATQTTDVQMLAQMSLKNPKYVTSQAITTSPTPSTLCQNFVVVEQHQKLDVLLMFLKRHPHDKIVVFVSTCNQVKYMYLAFSKILKKMRIPSMCLTSKMKQFRREEVFLTFCRCKSAVLFCTDVASRGLDFPLVHWVVQYDCPDSAQTYIHRAGRTARAGARGVSVLLLTSRETPMLSYLANKNLQLREVAVKPGLMHVSQDIFTALVVQGLKYEAQKAFIAYLRSVYFASNKHVFDVQSIDVERFAKSLGLLVVPDMSELQNLQRSAKNIPWDVVNGIAKRGAADAANGQQLTKKERHLQASDMFRMLEQKQKYATNLFDNPQDDSEDDFLVKKKTDPSARGENVATSLQLTAEERLAGLSKHKKRRFIETPDVRVKDLGLSSRVVFRSDDDEDDDDNEGERAESSYVAKQLRGAVMHMNGEAGNETTEDETSFSDKLRSRVGTEKLSDAERAKRLRRLRRLQKEGKIGRKTTLKDSRVTSLVGGPRPQDSDEGEYDSGSGDDASSNGSLGRLIRAAKGELYPESDDAMGGDAEGKELESDVDDEDYVYHGIDSSEDNIEEREGLAVSDVDNMVMTPVLKKRRRH